MVEQTSMPPRKKIRLLQVTPDLGIGGLPKVVVDICRNIDRSIFEPAVFCFKKCEEEFTHELIKSNVEVHVPARNSRWSRYLTFLVLARFIREKRFDIVHTHNTSAFIDGVIAAKMAGVAVSIHTDHARLYPDKKRYMFAERLLSYVTTKIVAVSEHTRDELIAYEKIAPQKIMVIPNGIDEKEHHCKSAAIKKQELGIEGRYPILGLGVRLSDQKGVIYLLQSMVTILAHFPAAMLVISGGGPLEDMLKQEARKLGIAQSVIFLSYRLDMPEILNMLDVYVLPSLWEGLPLAILEAMAARKPIVATAVGGTPTAIVHEQSGLLVKPRDPDALSHAILRLVKNPPFAARLADNAYQRYREKFTVQKMVSQYEQLYLDAFNRKTRKRRRLHLRGLFARHH